MKGESIETPFPELFSRRAIFPAFDRENESALHYTGVFVFKDSFWLPGLARVRVWLSLFSTDTLLIINYSPE